MNTRDRSVTRLLISMLVATFIIAAALAEAPAQSIPLDPLDQLKLVNVKAETVTFKGRKALRVSAATSGVDGEQLVVLPKIEFQDGVIELNLAGEPGPNAPEGSRGFVGVAFRVAPDESRFECFYLRPTNGRALTPDDHERDRDPDRPALRARARGLRPAGHPR